MARGSYISAAGLASRLAGLEGRCWVVNVEVARIQGILRPLLQEVEEVEQGLCPEVDKQETTGCSFEPGFAQWKELTGGEALGDKGGLEGWEETLQQLEAQPCPSSALSLLASLLESPQCRGRLLARLLTVLLVQVREGGRLEEAQFPLMPQPELMLEVNLHRAPYTLHALPACICTSPGSGCYRTPQPRPPWQCSAGSSDATQSCCSGSHDDSGTGQGMAVIY